MKRLFLGMIALVFYAQAAAANTDLLGLANLAEGSTPSYGEEIVTGMVEETGVKYLTAAPDSSGKLKYPINLSGDFEVELQVYKAYSRRSFELYLTADERHVKTTIGYYDFDFEMGTDSQKADKDQSKAFVENRTNKFRLSVSNNVAKIYINDVYSTKINLTPGLTYTQLIASGIESGDALYSLVISGNAGTVGGNTGTTPTTSCPTGTGTTLATIAPNLDIQIPNANYQTLGGAMNLWVNLKFAPSADGRLLWELTDYGLVGQ